MTLVTTTTIAGLLALLLQIYPGWAAVTVTGAGGGESMKASLHPVHHIGVVDQLDGRSSFAPTTTNTGSATLLAGGSTSGPVVSPIASISRSGQVVYAQNRDSYAQAAASAGYSNSGANSGGNSGGYGAPAGAASNNYGVPHQQQQGSTTYYYYHYPTQQQYGHGGDTTGKH